MTSTENAYKLIALVFFLAIISLGLLEKTEKGRRFRNSFFGVKKTNNAPLWIAISFYLFGLVIADRLPWRNLAIALIVIITALSMVGLVEAFLMQRRREFVWRILEEKH